MLLRNTIMFLIGVFFLYIEHGTNNNYFDTSAFSILVKGMKSTMHDEMKKHRMTLNLARLSSKGVTSSSDLGKLEEHYSEQHAAHMRQLSMIVKVVLTTFVIFIVCTSPRSCFTRACM